MLLSEIFEFDISILPNCMRVSSQGGNDLSCEKKGTNYISPHNNKLFTSTHVYRSYCQIQSTDSAFTFMEHTPVLVPNMFNHVFHVVS